MCIYCLEDKDDDSFFNVEHVECDDDLSQKSQQMKRVDEFTKEDIDDLRAFALALGLGFARDSRVADGLRRSCIHECGHALMDVVLGIHGWHIELAGRGPETFIPPTREVLSRQLDAGGLSSMMLAEKKALLSRTDLPGGMSNLFVAEARPDVREREVEVAPGRAARDVSVTEVPYASRPVPTAAVHRKSSPWPLIIGALALGGLLLAGIAALRGPRTASVPELSRVAPVVRAPDINRPQPQIEPPAMPVPEPTSQTTTTGAEIAKPDTQAAPQGEGIAAHFADTAPTGERFTLPGVSFEFGTTKLTGDGQAEIERMATAMKEHPNTRVRLEGHTDSVGNAEVNKPLSYGRAQAIKDMLVAQGVEPNRIETAGKRELDPVSDNDTREGRAQNRRVDAVILSR